MGQTMDPSVRKFDSSLSVKGMFHGSQHLSVSTTHIPPTLNRNTSMRSFDKATLNPNESSITSIWIALCNLDKRSDLSKYHFPFCALEYIGLERKLQNLCQKG